MNKKIVFTYLLVFVFVFSFALAFQIAADNDPHDPPTGIGCCWKECLGIGIGDWGHIVSEPHEPIICDCSYDYNYSHCFHECNTCAL